jgi:uncharacterized protein YukE
MGELGAYQENVKFGWVEAESLAAELRSAATTLDAQVTERNRIKGPAREEWRGKFAEEFDGRVELCAGDAGRLADALRDAATKLDELTRLAREEQERREYAREWEANNDDSGFLEGARDWAFGEDDLPPPPPPVDPPRIAIGEPGIGAR